MNKLMKYRKQIDEIDTEIIKLLGKRFRIIDSISAVKSINRLPVKDTGRMEEIFNARSKLAFEYSVPTLLVQKIFREIIKYSMIEEQKHLKNMTDC